MRTLSVISSNIRYDEPDDDKFRWENRRDFLATSLLDFEPDVIATQEGKHPQLRDIAERLVGMACVESHRTWQDSLMYPCLFYNPATLTLQGSGDIWLSTTPSIAGSLSFGSLFPRLCTWARFDEGVLAINVHLDNSGSETRLLQSRVLVEQIDALRQGDESVMLIGDFNESPQCPVRSLLNDLCPDLNDPWLQLGQEEEASHHNFDEPIDYGSRIDWILVTDALQAEDIFLDKARSEDGMYPSDHYPLKAKFVLRDGS
jgi:endonuclease/exonuclease/phosphatase family metal-dependent hydrolase